ncbi:hypothetical protein LTR17_024804 [Elasticomyces elasticus]|nr:hypothetical protein LTR17_024804 [Elasticomyces elasticus]
MLLLELPTELLDTIIGLTLPDGLESFALSCKTVYSIANFWQKDFNEEQIARLKKQLLGDDINLAAVGGLLGQSHCLRRANQDPEQWLAELRYEECEDDEEPDTYREPHYSTNMATILLLTLLPNLRELMLPNEWQSLPEPDNSPPDDQLWSVLDVITCEASLCPSSNAALSRLKTILPYADVSHDERNGLRELSPFLPIKSMAKSRSNIQLTHVELAGCCIDSDGITELVKHTPQLTTLKYSHHVKWHGCQHDWDAGNFVRAIEEHCGSTLENLAVTIDTLYGMVETRVDSMQGFRRLHSVELDILVFAGPPPEFELCQGTIDNGYKYDITKIPCLAEILPRTIKQVRLFVSSRTGDGDAGIELQTLASLFRQYASEQPLCQPDKVEVRVGFGHAYAFIDEVKHIFDAHNDSSELNGLMNQWQVDPTITDGLTWVEEFHKKYAMPYG